MRTALAIAAVLTLGGVAAAPAVTSPASVAPAVDQVFVEVAFDHDVTQSDRDLLDEAGATAVTVTGPRTYRAAVPAGTTVAGAQVRAVEASDKLDAALDRSALSPVVVRTTGESLDALTSEVSRLGGDLLGTNGVPESDGLVELVTVLDGATAASLAASPSVAYVGPAPVAITPEGERTNAVLARLVESGSDAALGLEPSWTPTYEEWLAEVGLDGEGVVVAVVDDGVDEEHPQLNVVAAKDYMEPHDEPIDGSGHGSHVAGIIGATGTGVPDAVAADRGGFEPGVGVAPGVGLTNQNLIGISGILTVDHVALFEEVVSDAIGFGANIWNASWTSGEGTGVGYLASGARLDSLARDGQPGTEGLQQFTMAFSAGNSGSGEQTLTAPKAAKNIIVVASLDSPTNKPYLSASGDPREVSSFSSRGPTKDGRLGITVAAPGADVRSTKSLGAGGLCFEPVTDPVAPLYSFCSGTSMASPHAAGAAALVTQWWRDGQGAGEDPSPALIKALLVNSAVDVKFPDIPNIHEGWGRIDLESLFRPDTGRVIRDQADVLTEPGEVHEHTVEVAGDAPLKVTMDWLDPAGDPAAEAAIVNDLDLELVAPDGTVHRGNNFDKGWSVPGGDADRLELLENVYVEQPAAGTWTVRVRAHALPGDGALGRGDATDQDYTLVVTGTDG